MLDFRAAILTPVSCSGWTSEESCRNRLAGRIWKQLRLFFFSADVISLVVLVFIVGGIIATYAFLAKDAPRYISGYSVCVAFICLSGLSCCAYLVACMWENRRRDNNPSAAANLSLEEKQRLGDLNPDYRYLL